VARILLLGDLWDLINLKTNGVAMSSAVSFDLIKSVRLRGNAITERRVYDGDKIPV